MDLLTISKLSARRFILGRQGLWPGRRWKGKKGTARAIQECEEVQEDPLIMVARSHDLVLHSRVLDYKPRYLEHLMYQDRLFFDYGGALCIYPMSELPYWRVHMQERSHVKKVEDFVFSRPELFDQIRQELRSRGPLGNRDLGGRAVQSNYRGRKESSLAMFDMWLSGELMIHHRNRFERVYDFRENIAPAEFDFMVSQTEAEEFFARKSVAHKGLMRERTWKTELEYYVRRSVSKEDIKLLLANWIDQKFLVELRIEGSPEKYIALGEDLALLDALEADKVPKRWRPIGPTTTDEVTFLAPLDIVSARGRAKKLFDFEYLWEVYKPAHQRRWGYYTLPILYGDDLVARLDPMFDRGTKTLKILGFWLEDDAPAARPEFASALANGLIRFGQFLQAEQIELSGIQPTRMRADLRRILRERSEIKVM